MSEKMSFSEELSAFRARTTDPGFSALILLGTRQDTTAALLIGTLKVQRIAFLLTDETRDMPDKVAEKLGASTDTWMCPPGDHDTTLSVYKGLRQLMETWKDLDPATIAVDVTGGLKPMSLGLEKAAHVLGLKTIYVQSEYEKLPDGRSVPKPGSQWLGIPPDPYLVFGDLEAAEAQRLYSAHDYSGAQRIFARLAERVPAPEGAHYTALANLTAMYAAWDVLDLVKATAYASALFGQDITQVPQLAKHIDTLRMQSSMLAHLKIVLSDVVHDDNQRRLDTLADSEAMLPLLGTLHAAALRRADQGRYDFAALFRYRCLELISQHRLATHGILSSRPDYRHLKVECDTLKENFKAVQQAVGREKLSKLPKRSIALFDGYMLLSALDDSLVRGYAIKRIEQRSHARNHSVLAHGYSLITETDYNHFAEVVDEMLDQLFTLVLKRPRADWERTTRFIEPFVG